MASFCERLNDLESKVCQEVPVYRLSEPDPGVNVRIWNGGDGDSVPHDDVGVVFAGPIDPATGFPSHPNPPTAQVVEADWNYSTANIGGVAYANDGTDQLEGWGWISTAGLGDILLSENNQNTGERGEVWIGACCGQPQRQPGFNDAATGNTPSADRGVMDPSGPFSEGVHFVYFRMSDFSAFGGINLEYTTDLSGDTGWSNFPADRSFVDKPVVECELVDECEPLPEGWALCPPALCSPVMAPNLGGSEPPPLSTLVPVPDNEADTAIRTGSAGSTGEFADAGHNHPIVRQSNPGDPVLTPGGEITITQTLITDRWSTEETYEYHFRVRVEQPVGTGWGWVAVPTIAGFQQPQIFAVGTYRPQSTAIQEDNGDNQGASPRGPFMGAEAHHWTSSNRVYAGYFRRDDNPVDMFIEFNVRYIRT